MTDGNVSDVAKQGARTSFLVVTGTLGSTLFLSLTVLILARILGPDQYGAYTVALVIPGAFQIFIGFGVNTALIRYTAFNLAKGDFVTARRMSTSAILFLMAVGSLMTVVCYFGAPVLSEYVLHRPTLTFYVQLASLSILGQALLQCSYAGLIGWKSPGFASLAVSMQGLLKLLLSPALVIVGLGVFGAVFAHTVSYVVAGSIFVVLLYARKVKGAVALGTRDFVSDVRVMLGFGIPEYIGRVGFQFSQASFTLIVISAIAVNSVVAFYQAAFNIITALAAVSAALALALTPTFASLDALKGDLRSALSETSKYVSYFMVPIVFLILGTSPVLINILYGGAYSTSADYLNWLVVSALPAAMGLAVLPPFFNGIGRTRLTMLLFISGAVLIFVLAPTLAVVFSLGVYGIIFSLIISNVAELTLGLYLAWKYTRTSIDYSAAARIFLASDICYGLLLFILAYSSFGAFTTLILEVLVFVIAYFTIAPLLRILNNSDFERLKTSTSELGFLSRIFGLLFRYELLLIRLSSRRPRREQVALGR